MKTRVRAVKDVRETVHDERVALVEEVDGHRERVVPVAQTTNTRRSARTLYNTGQGATSLDAHGAADAAAAAAGQLMLSQAEEEQPVEDGTQEPLPDEPFSEIPDINAALATAEEHGEGERFGTPEATLTPTEHGTEDEGGDTQPVEAVAEYDASGPSEGRAPSGQKSSGQKGGRRAKAVQRSAAAPSPRTPGKAPKKGAVEKAAPASANPAKGVKRGAAAAAKEPVESEPTEQPAEEEESEGAAVKERKASRARPPSKAKKGAPPSKQLTRKAAAQTVGVKAPPIRKAAGKAAAGGRRRRNRVEKYSRYLYRVLKSVHPNLGISQHGMEICESLINDIYDRLMVESVRLLRITGAKTLSAREIQTAVKLLIPGEMQAHAVLEGTKAVHRAASYH